jgi:hypothetical protein
MSEHILKTIEDIQAEIRKVEESIRPKKVLVNQLCVFANIDPIYADSDLGSPEMTAQRPAVRRNAFYGKALGTCVREFLEGRASLSVREATLEEIFSALKEGGYDLKQISDKEDDQKRGVAITLGKNSQTFHRLPTGDYGLLAWYPSIRERRRRLTTADDAATFESVVADNSANAAAATEVS